MWKFLAIIALCVSASAQLATMDQIPTARQSNQVAGDNLLFGTNVVSGNVLVATYYSAAAITTPTIADTVLSTWTLRVTQGGAGTFYVWSATAASSGADTVTITESGATNQTLGIVEYQNVTELVDVVASAAVSVSGGAFTMPSATTVHYRDLVLDLIMVGGEIFPPHNVAYTQDFVAELVTIGRPDEAIYSRLSGDPGTFTGATYTTGGGTTALAVVLALRSTSSLTVSTPSIPDAVISQAYSFQMQATGGLGTNVWTTTAGTLPCGLTLSSGGVISGTPTCSNGNTITFKVTDTAAATATASLTLHVGNSGNTITRVQGASGQVLNGATSGNIVLVGIMNTTAFSSVKAQTARLTDGLGSIYTRVPGASSDLQFLYWAIVGSNGNINLSVTPALTSGFVWMSEWTNIQPVFDTGVVSNYVSTTGSSPITSSPITSPVSEMLYAFASPGTAAATITVQSPFLRDFNGTGGTTTRQAEADYDIGAAAGSNTATWTQSGNTSNNFNMTLLGFRPTVSGTAPLASTHRRSQVY